MYIDSIFHEYLMGTEKRQTTREKVRTAAWELIGEGISPSRTKIRERIGPGGSDATVADELHRFWEELGEHIKKSKGQPDIPVEFIAAFKEILEQARQIESHRWERERRELSEKSESANQERRQAVNAMKSAQEAHNTLTVELQKTQGKLRQTNDYIQHLEQVQRQLNEKVDSLQNQLQVSHQKEKQLQHQRMKEVELAYARARETEERLTKLYEEKRVKYEQTATALDHTRDQLKNAETSKVTLEEQLKDAQSYISSLKIKVSDFVQIQTTINDIQKDNAVLRSQLETSLKREAETQKKLEEKIGAITRMELELAAAQDTLEKQSKVIDNMKKNSKSKKSASKNRSLRKKK
jgi:chromosome segregation ATPase